MTKISHARSRRAALLGLLLQVLAFATLLILAYTTRQKASPADPTFTTPFDWIPSLFYLAWFTLAGAPIWLAALLVFRQRELAALEQFELEQLKRERAAGGASEAIFEDAESGFRVAQARLEWMRRWLVPTLGLIVSVGLTVGGVVLFGMLRQEGLSLRTTLDAQATWGLYQNEPIAMIVLSIVLVLTFLLSRYVSGMAGEQTWQLLRGCGSFMLATSIFVALLIVAFGVEIYANSNYLLRIIAFAVPVVMVVLGVETFLNFIFDLYRPRTPGVEPRAAFDSRLLGLFSEPGGIAHSIAEAVNYQFGFEVSKTWFFQLMMRTAVPLLAVGVLTLWLMTTMVIVEPYEHAVVERFGAQRNVDEPLEPGLHWKLPWPIDIVHRYNTGQIHDLYIGFDDFDANPDLAELTGETTLLWTQDKHLNLEHFNFLIPLTPREKLLPPTPLLAEDDNLGVEFRVFDESAAAVPVNIVRMYYSIQYRIDPTKLRAFTRQTADPVATLRREAWQLTSQFNAHSDMQYLLSEGQRDAGDLMRQRLQARSNELGLGLEIIYVGLLNVHPESTVAEAYRNVVNAEQEMLAAIREARVDQNQTLALVAGNRSRALHLAHAIGQLGDLELAMNRALNVLGDVADEQAQAFEQRLLEYSPLFQAVERQQWDTYRAEQRFETVAEGLRLGMQYTEQDRSEATEALTMQRRELEQAADELADAIQPIVDEMESELGASEADALLSYVKAEVGRDMWNRELLRLEDELRGQAAATLSQAKAQRWEIEMDAAADLTRVLAEQEAFRRAPNVYLARLYTNILVEGYRDALKYFLAFEPGDRKVHLRYQAEENVRPTFSPARGQ